MMLEAFPIKNNNVSSTYFGYKKMKNIASTALLLCSSGTLISKNEAVSITVLHCTT
jgi:hypothetical protein